VLLVVVLGLAIDQGATRLASAIPVDLLTEIKPARAHAATLSGNPRTLALLRSPPGARGA
jgi:hypothetical protein